MSNKNEITPEEMTPEMKQQMDDIQQILETPVIEPTVALNIIINAVQVCYESSTFNDLDRALISKALQSLSAEVKAGKDFVIKVDKNLSEEKSSE